MGSRMDEMPLLDRIVRPAAIAGEMLDDGGVFVPYVNLHLRAHNEVLGTLPRVLRSRKLV